LGERVSLQSTVAMWLLFVSIGLISLGAGRTNDLMAASADTARGPFWVAVALSAACLAGFVYAALSVAVRKMLTGGTSFAVVLFIVPAVGVVTLGPISLFRLGISGVLETHLHDLGIMLAAGILNLLAYLAGLHGLKLVHVLNANALSASQVVMAAVAGVIFFREPPSLGLVLGVILTVAGMILLKRPADAAQNSITDSPPSPMD